MFVFLHCVDVLCCDFFLRCVDDFVLRFYFWMRRCFCAAFVFVLRCVDDFVFRLYFCDASMFMCWVCYSALRR